MAFGRKPKDAQADETQENEQHSQEEGDQNDGPTDPDASAITKAFAQASGLGVGEDSENRLLNMARIHHICLQRSGLASRNLSFNDLPSWLFELEGMIYAEAENTPATPEVLANPDAYFADAYTRHEAALMARDHGTQES